MKRKQSSGCKDKPREPCPVDIDTEETGDGERYPIGTSGQFTKRHQFIYEIIDLVGRSDITLDEIHQKVVKMLPSLCSYPNITCARIAIDGSEFRSRNYAESKWKLSSHIKRDGKTKGIVEVCCPDETPLINEEPFSKVEQLLIDITAQLLGITTESRHKDKAFWGSRAKLTNLFSMASDGIVVMSLTGLIRQVNDRLLKMTGYDRGDELIGRSILEITAPQNYRDAMISLRKAIREQTPITAKYSFRRADSSEFVGRVNLNILTDSSGIPVEFIAIVSDIDHLERLEYLEYALAERVRELECLNSITFLTEKPGLTLDDLCQGVVNVLLASSGYPRIECVRLVMGDKKFETENYGETQWKLSFNIRVKGVQLAVLEVNYTNPDINKEPFLTDANVYFESVADRLGRIIEFMHAVEALRESEEFRSSLLQNSPNPVIVLNPDSSIKYVNPAFEKVTGFSFSELTGEKAPYPWWPDDALEKRLRDLHRRMLKGATQVEAAYKAKSGERFWVEMTFVPVKSNGELKYCLSSWIERTVQKRLKDDLDFYVREITKAQEEERKRIALELHDGTIQDLFSLLTNIDEIIKVHDESPGRCVQQLDQLKAKIDSIMDEMRSFTHELRPALLDELGLIPALEMLVEEYAASDKLDCRMKVIGDKRGLPPEAEPLLFRIVQEALCNVRKHSGAKLAMIKVKFTRGQLRLYITDNGCGFELPKPMCSLVHSGKLGLMGMQERVRLLNGSFSVKSEPAGGTTVAVEVPL